MAQILFNIAALRLNCVKQLIKFHPWFWLGKQNTHGFAMPLVQFLAFKFQKTKRLYSENDFFFLSFSMFLNRTHLSPGWWRQMVRLEFFPPLMPRLEPTSVSRVALDWDLSDALPTELPRRGLFGKWCKTWFLSFLSKTLRLLFPKMSLGVGLIAVTTTLLSKGS